MTAPQTTRVTQALLPCPFCGWLKVFLSNTKEAPFWVECPDCFAQGSPCDTEAEAIAAWNTRAQAEAEAGAREAALREALQGFVTSISGRNTLEKMLTINHAELVTLVANARALLAKLPSEGPSDA